MSHRQSVVPRPSFCERNLNGRLECVFAVCDVCPTVCVRLSNPQPSRGLRLRRRGAPDPRRVPKIHPSNNSPVKVA